MPPVKSMPERINTLCPEVMTFVTADSRVMVLAVLMTILTYSAVFNSPKMPLMAIHTVAMRIWYVQASVSDILMAFNTC